jgi:hypothetical protein
MTGQGDLFGRPPRRGCPRWPKCGCGTQSGPHTCEWEQEQRDADDITRNYHRGNPRSKEANSRANKAKQRAAIIEFGVQRGTHGFTCDEAEVALGMSHQSCSARCSELKRDRVVLIFGKRLTRTGCKADVLLVRGVRYSEAAE